MAKEDLDEEIDAIEAIYPKCLEPMGSMYKLEIPDRHISIQLSFPSSYPTESPHILSVKYGPDKGLLEDILQSIFVPEQVCLFDFIETVRETFEDTTTTTNDTDLNDPEIDGEDHIHSKYQESSTNYSKLSKEDLTNEIFAHWISGPKIVDRKSVFIAFACEVHSNQEVEAMLSLLKQDKHIAKATHNIVAYRIKGSNGVIIQDNDEDGETAAGGRLQHLLEV